jgi:hypothetical protein
LFRKPIFSVQPAYRCRRGKPKNFSITLLFGSFHFQYTTYSFFVKGKIAVFFNFFYYMGLDLSSFSFTWHLS